MDMETQVLQALARGYCSPENSGKTVDPDLIKAMAKEIVPLPIFINLRIQVHQVVPVVESAPISVINIRTTLYAP